MRTFNPDQTKRDQIDLDINCTKILKDKSNRVDRSRGLEKARFPDESRYAPGKKPLDCRLAKGGERSKEDGEVNQPSPGSKLFPQRAHQTEMKSAPVKDEKDRGQD